MPLSHLHRTGIDAFVSNAFDKDLRRACAFRVSKYPFSVFPFPFRRLDDFQPNIVIACRH